MAISIRNPRLPKTIRVHGRKYFFRSGRYYRADGSGGSMLPSRILNYNGSIRSDVEVL